MLTPTRHRVVVDINNPALRKALKIMAVERDSTVRAVVLTALAVAYPAVDALVKEELRDEAIVEQPSTIK